MITTWDLISIGNISRNRYWGESDDQSYRSAICTSVLLRGEGFSMIVDPPYGDADVMASELDRLTGLKVGDVDTVFLTHEHGDHVVGVPNFPDVRVLAAPPVAEVLNTSDRFSQTVEEKEGPLFSFIDLIHTPGHTLSHHSLRFDWSGQSVVVAADAAMTRDFWNNRQGYFNSVDFGLATESIEKLSKIADVVIPGHGNYFIQ